MKKITSPTRSQFRYKTVKGVERMTMFKILYKFHDNMDIDEVTDIMSQRIDSYIQDNDCRPKIYIIVTSNHINISNKHINPGNNGNLEFYKYKYYDMIMSRGNVELSETTLYGNRIKETIIGINNWCKSKLYMIITDAFNTRYKIIKSKLEKKRLIREENLKEGHELCKQVIMKSLKLREISIDNVEKVDTFVNEVQIKPNVYCSCKIKKQDIIYPIE